MFFEKTLRHVFFGSANSLRVFWRQKGVVYFFIAASWMGVFFDGETWVSVFFRTFEIFDTIHAISSTPFSIACLTFSLSAF